MAVHRHPSGGRHVTSSAIDTAGAAHWLDAQRSPDCALREQVLADHMADRKMLSPSLFYDAAGARLFEAICELPVYYVTRTELAILAAHAGDIAVLAGPRVALIEYGSGAGVKVQYLLDALRDPAAYVPVDISREQLCAVASPSFPDRPSATFIPPKRLPFSPEYATWSAGVAP